jgi:hypothetical protein
MMAYEVLTCPMVMFENWFTITYFRSLAFTLYCLIYSTMSGEGLPSVFFSIVEPSPISIDRTVRQTKASNIFMKIELILQLVASFINIEFIC